MIRLRNKATKQHERFHTLIKAAEFLRCSKSHVQSLSSGKINEIRGWSINKYPATKRKPA